MFTGIVEEVGRVASASSRNLVISASSILHRLEPGGSIAVSGACLTVTSFDTASFTVDIMPETIKRTNLGLLGVGDRVNLELPLVLGGEMGGHLVQGHVDATGRVASIDWENEAMLIRFEAPKDVMRYIVEKGFIAVDGVSLTVVAIDTPSFWISVVDYTRTHTTLGDMQVGDLSNLEVDILAKYVERLSQPQHVGINTELLQEHGFL